MTATELEVLKEQEFIEDQQMLWEQNHNPDETFIDRWDDIED